MKNVKLGIAPIGWTNDDCPDLGGEISFEQCVSEMSAAGYKGCEIGNKFPKDPQNLLNHLNPLNLQVVCAWFSTLFTDANCDIDLHKEDFLKHIRFLKSVGAEYVDICECGNAIQQTELPVLENKVVFNQKQWDKLFKGIEMFGQLANREGLKMVYHYHMGTGVQNMTEIDMLMKHTNPDEMELLYDTGHAYFAGVDPLDIVKAYKSRIKYVHLKDIRENVLAQVKKDQLSFLDAVRAGVFTVPGDGNINFDPIFDHLQDYTGWMLVEAEQDPAKANPLEYAKMSMNFMKKYINEGVVA